MVPENTRSVTLNPFVRRYGSFPLRALPFGEPGASMIQRE